MTWWIEVLFCMKTSSKFLSKMNSWFSKIFLYILPVTPSFLKSESPQQMIKSDLCSAQNAVQIMTLSLLEILPLMWGSFHLSDWVKKIHWQHCSDFFFTEHSSLHHTFNHSLYLQSSCAKVHFSLAFLAFFVNWEWSVISHFFKPLFFSLLFVVVCDSMNTMFMLILQRVWFRLLRVKTSRMSSWFLSILQDLFQDWLTLFSWVKALLMLSCTVQGLRLKSCAIWKKKWFIFEAPTSSVHSWVLNFLQDVFLGLGWRGMADNGCCCGLFTYN